MIDLISYLIPSSDLSFAAEAFCFCVGLLVIDSILTAIFRSLFRR